MKQEQVEKIRNGLKNLESFILESILLVYPLLLIQEGAFLRPHYLLLFVAVIVGVAAYLLFSVTPYSIIWGLLLSLATVVPFYFIGLPLAVVNFMFVYVFWRMYANFGSERLNRMPFILINTIVFTFFFLFTQVFSQRAHALEVTQVLFTLFVATIVLFISIRFILIWLTSRQMDGFRLIEAGKVFGSLLLVGLVAFLGIYYLVLHIRTAIIAIVGFLFGGLFMLLGKAVTPALDAGVAWLDYLRNKNVTEEEPAVPEFDFQLEEKQTFAGPFDINLFSLNTIFTIAGFVLIVIVVLLIRNRKAAIKDSARPRYSLGSLGRNKEKETIQIMYDYSKATDAVRIAYRDFEKEAISAKSPRFTGETVKEWFARMGWGQSEKLFDTYDKVRYGSISITEEEGRHFISELQEIIKKYFKKDV